ncbi:hypothetical protein I79_006808 [Cricetulus griseus]|uniref:Uncharacterized protein n=1 Tax=Cricetulus griseus TaxID=10029 RepID=G3H8U8_CRIGR|nr:hypothetical protein I79_006808 [Cricetulus griseus]
MDPSLSWPPESSHPPKLAAAVSPVFAKNWKEEREAQGVDREGRESAGLKALGSRLGSGGRTETWLPGLPPPWVPTAGRARPW